MNFINNDMNFNISEKEILNDFVIKKIGTKDKKEKKLN